MEPDFAYAKNAGSVYISGGQDVRETALNQLEYMANRAEQQADHIERFIARFRGHPMGSDAARPVPVPSGHEGQIARLNEQLNRIESLTDSLASIG